MPGQGLGLGFSLFVLSLQSDHFARSRLGPRVLVVPGQGVGLGFSLSALKEVWGEPWGVHESAADFTPEEIWPRARLSSRLLPKGIPKELVLNGWSWTIGFPCGQMSI